MRTTRLVTNAARSVFFKHTQVIQPTFYSRYYATEQTSPTSQKQRKAAFIMSGCGYLDGNEITESVSFIIACSQANIQPTFFSVQNKEIEDVFIHTTRVIDPAEERITHKEASRITRGPTKDVSRLSPDEFDLLIIPGGGGNTRVYSNFEQEQWKGSDIAIDSDVKNAIQGFYNAKKPIAVSSHAAILLAKALQGKSIQIAIGKTNEKNVVEAVENLNSKVNEISDPTQVITDQSNKIVSVPGFSASANTSFSDVFNGAREAIRTVLSLFK